jgi:hypothetical protein
MPILLGMILTGHMAPEQAELPTGNEEAPLGYDDEDALIME